MTDAIQLCDGYKLDHRRQAPQGIQYTYENWTARASRIPDSNHVVFFGLQYFLKKYLMEEMEATFFSQPIDQVCAKYENLVNGYLGPNTIGSEHIAALHELGYVPMEFKALPEGTLVPLRVPMFTLENTHPDFAWIPGYFETLLSNVLWLPCTSATTAYRYRKFLDDAAEWTGGDPEFVNWQGHDFSMRGMAGVEAAQLSGMGHLLSFWGSDTIPAIDTINRYYTNPDGVVSVVGSVAATEHSVMSAGGQLTEDETFRRLLTEIYPGKDPEGFEIFSVVSDTWNLWEVLTEILPKLKDEIMARHGKMVIRPDSGDPVKIICGDPDANDERVRKGVIELLWDEFGGTRTDQGFKQLDPHVGAIYGDSITYERCKAIVHGLERKGFASTNMVFGIGSYTYQHVTRDTYGFAMKATSVVVNGQQRPIFKQPVTDDGTKHSAVGRLAVLPGINLQTGAPDLVLVNNASPEEEAASLLEPVWRNGQFIKGYSFEGVRNTLTSQYG